MKNLDLNTADLIAQALGTDVVSLIAGVATRATAQVADLLNVTIDEASEKYAEEACYVFFALMTVLEKEFLTSKTIN